ncbi:MAG: hypothetical protein CHACPFDD_02192 [Phycisphaerae bacterium]|nr:hypothetical protein [Phycisphaerae bacterium]
MPTTAPTAPPFDPVTLIIIAAAAIVLLSIAAAWHRRRLDRAIATQRRSAILSQRQRNAGQRADVARLASRIIATSSSPAIAGFEIVRQIEAVFTDGHATPTDAVEALKAIAATLGANALVNLESQRVGTGKCTARGDAVMARPLPLAPPPDPPPAAPAKPSDEPPQRVAPPPEPPAPH